MAILRRTDSRRGEALGPGGAQFDDERTHSRVPHPESEMLPKPLRHEGGGHDGSHPFLTHEFIDAVLSERRPTVDVYEAVAYTATGIVAHQSSLKGGEQLKIPDFGRGT